jgi:hypothetical protein
MDFHCDNCGKFIGTFLYGKGGVEEKAFITNYYVTVNNYDNYGRAIGKIEVLAPRLPDIICFDCNNLPATPPTGSKK